MNPMQASFDDSPTTPSVDKLALPIKADAVALHCHVSVETVYQHARNGLIPATRNGKGGSGWTFNSADLAMFYDHFEPVREKNRKRELMIQKRAEAKARAAARVTEHVEESSGRGSRINPSFSPTADMIEWAMARGHSRERVDLETDKFVQYWIAEGRTKVNWQAAWRNWIMNMFPAAPASKHDDDASARAIRDLANRFEQVQARNDEQLAKLTRLAHGAKRADSAEIEALGVHVSETRKAMEQLDDRIQMIEAIADIFEEPMSDERTSIQITKINDVLTQQIHKLESLAITVRQIEARPSISADDKKAITAHVERMTGIESSQRALTLAVTSLDESIQELTDRAASHDRSRASHYADIQKIAERIEAVEKRLDRVQSGTGNPGNVKK